MVCPAWWNDADVHVCSSSVVLMLALVLKHAECACTHAGKLQGTCSF